MRISRLLGLNRVLVAVIFLMLLSLNAFLVANNVSNPNIRSDGKGYYLYLPSLFIHHDMKMKWTEPLRDDGGIAFSLSKTANGGYLDKYTTGMAILWLPFFLAAHLVSHLIGQEPNGFSIVYQASIGFAAALFTAVGCLFVFKNLRRHFSTRVAYGTVITLLLGTNMLSYAVYDAGFTHVYSFSLLAIILYLTPIWYKKPSYRNSAMLITLATLLILVRPVNILLLIVPLLWNVTDKQALVTRLRWFATQRLQLAFMAGLGFLLCIPQLLYWKYVSGSWVVFSYVGETFNFAHPQIIKVLFSMDRGVFVWAPILLLVLPGLYLLRKRATAWSTSIYILLPIWLYVTSSWHSWQYGASYGHRAFIDIFPLLALGLAASFSSLKTVVAKRIAISVVALLMAANLFLMYMYWVVIVPSAGTTPKIYMNVWKQGVNQIRIDGFWSFPVGFFSIVLVSMISLSIYALHASRSKRDLKPLTD